MDCDECNRHAAGAPTDQRCRRGFHAETAKGREVLKRAPAPLSGVLPAALVKLDGRTLSRLDRDLGRLVELLGKKNSRNLPLGE